MHQLPWFTHTICFLFINKHVLVCAIIVCTSFNFTLNLSSTLSTSAKKYFNLSICSFLYMYGCILSKVKVDCVHEMQCKFVFISTHLQNLTYSFVLLSVKLIHVEQLSLNLHECQKTLYWCFLMANSKWETALAESVVVCLQLLTTYQLLIRAMLLKSYPACLVYLAPAVGADHKMMCCSCLFLSACFIIKVSIPSGFTVNRKLLYYYTI